MIMRISDMTERDKKKFFETTKKQLGSNWPMIEEKMRKEIDDAFDDERFPKMSPDDQIDAAYARKEFGKNKPSMVDYMLWVVRFATKSEYIEIPD